MLKKWIDGKKTTTEGFKLREITERDVRRIVKKMKGGNTQGPDQIPSAII